LGNKKKRQARPGFREAIGITGGDDQEIPRKLTAQRARHPGTRDQAHPFGASAARRREKGVEYLLYKQGTTTSLPHYLVVSSSILFRARQGLYKADTAAHDG
jgi:hypothetical protein